MLSGWEYQLFCFCLWPLNDEGASLLERAAQSSLGLPLGVAAAAQHRPAYHQLLLSFLHAFAPLPTPPCAAPAAASPTKAATPAAAAAAAAAAKAFAPSAAAAGGAELLLDAVSQFWLCQNPAPAANDPNQVRVRLRVRARGRVRDRARVRSSNARSSNPSPNHNPDQVSTPQMIFQPTSSAVLGRTTP